MGRRIGIGLLLAVLLASSLSFAFLRPGHAAAAAQCQAGKNFPCLDIDAAVSAYIIDQAHVSVSIAGHYDINASSQIDLGATAGGIYFDGADVLSPAFTGNSHDNNGTLNVFSQGGDKKVGVQGGCQSTLNIANYPNNIGDNGGNGPVGAYQGTITLSLSGSNAGTASTNGCVSAGTIGVSVSNPGLCSANTAGDYGGPASQTNSVCAGVPFNGQTIPQQASDIQLYFSDPNTVIQVDDDPTYDNVQNTDEQYVYDQATGYFLRQTGDQCKDGLKIFPNQVTVNGAKQDTNPVTSIATYYHRSGAKDGSCAENEMGTFLTMGFTNAPATGANGGPGATAPGGASGGATVDTCPVNQVELKWIVCPFVTAAEDFGQRMNGLIEQHIAIDTDNLFAPDGQYHQAEQRFQNIAVSLLVIAALIMVASEALGTGVFKALTVRELLPRFLIAVFFIEVGWDFAKYLCIFANNIGVWGYSLVTAPFGDLAHVSFNWASTAAAGVFGVGMLASLGVFGILSLLATACISLLVGFAVLFLRQIGIDIGVVLLPVIIAMWVLP